MKLFLSFAFLLLASLCSAQTTTVCGPPAYACSRTDFDIVPVPAVAPFSGSIGANQIKKDPDFGTNILRCTDANTNNGGSFAMADSGVRMFNLGHSLLFVRTYGGGSKIMKFTGSPMSCTVLAYKLPYVAVWSPTQAYVFYHLKGSAVIKTTVPKDLVSPLVETVLTDFANCPGAPVPFTVIWHGILSMSANGRSFTVGLSNTGPQETGEWIANWTYGKTPPCRLANTATGQVTGWGPNGVWDLPNRMTLHEAANTPNQNYVGFSTNNCFAGCGITFGPYLWNLPTLHAAGCTTTEGRCSGHASGGQLNKYMWGPGTGQIKVIPWATWGDESTYSFLLPSTSIPPRVCNDPSAPDMRCWNNDLHASYNGANTTDTLPANTVVTAHTHVKFCYWPAPVASPFQNEVLVIPSGDLKYHREGHTFNTGCDNNFGARWAIGQNSNDSRFIALPSDMEGQLGCQDGTTTCDIASRRTDIFVYKTR